MTASSWLAASAGPETHGCGAGLPGWLAWIGAEALLEPAEAAEQGRFLSAAEPAGPGGFAETRTGLDHISFCVGCRDELTDWDKALRDRGVQVSPISDQPWGSVLIFRDPDNIQLELCAPTAARARCVPCTEHPAPDHARYARPADPKSWTSRLISFPARSICSGD